MIWNEAAETIEAEVAETMTQTAIDTDTGQRGAAVSMIAMTAERNTDNRQSPAAFLPR